MNRLPDAASPAAGDRAYLDDAHFREPREIVKAVIDAIRADREGLGDASTKLVDVGCGSGAFLFHARPALGVTEALGIEIAPLLVEEARRRVPDVEFVVGGVLSPPAEALGRFDVCTCLSVVAMLDDELEVLLPALISLTKPGGDVYLVDIVNPHPVDMLMRYRTSAPDGPGPWRSGFNVRSEASYRRACDAIGATLVSTREFRMPFALPFQEPTRSWTLATDDDPHQLVLGTGQMLPTSIVRITNAR